MLWRGNVRSEWMSTPGEWRPFILDPKFNRRRRLNIKSGRTTWERLATSETSSLLTLMAHLLRNVVKPVRAGDHVLVVTRARLEKKARRLGSGAIWLPLQVQRRRFRLAIPRVHKGHATLHVFRFSHPTPAF